jgi:hypothetical protein
VLKILFRKYLNKKKNGQSDIAEYKKGGYLTLKKRRPKKQKENPTKKVQIKQ